MHMTQTTLNHVQSRSRKRLRLTLRGTLQGVGFRPFAYRLAKQCSLGGWIKNTPTGVLLEIEGAVEHLQTFQERLITESPQASTIQNHRVSIVQEEGTDDFFILPSQQNGTTNSVLSADLATCHDCLNEITDPHSRRFRYPFTTCARCGPRYSIIIEHPYRPQ